jgi:hypothetical protein
VRPDDPRLSPSQQSEAKGVLGGQIEYPLFNWHAVCGSLLLVMALLLCVDCVLLFELTNAR